MAGCVTTGPVDGGTFNDTILNNPEIHGGVITGSEISGAQIKDSIAIDDAAAVQLANSLCPFIQDCVSPGVSSSSPGTSVSQELPTTMIGPNRNKLMGEPDVWLEISGFLVPAYIKA